jgi:RNA polymerase-binding transcription factor DksA
MKLDVIAASPHWDWHYRALSRLRDELIRERDEHTAAFRLPLARGGEDASDVAAEQTEHAELLAELRNEEAELAEVEAALQRIRDGTYGICAATGKPIPAARLRALPWARCCREAAGELVAPRPSSSG